MDRDDPGYPGQAAYNRSMLAIYDPWVIGFMAPVVWRSPVHPGVARYRQHLGRRHLDVGPGTGYFIEKAEPAEGTEITLLDPNPKVLARSSRRLAALHPVTVEADVMKPLPLEGRFDSARVQATNIFERKNGNWHVVLHHASPLPLDTEEEGASEVVQ